MKKHNVYDCSKFPAELFGTDIVREVRLIISPETTGDENLRIVSTTIPPGGISEGHIHPDADEFIYFDIPGKAILDDVTYDVPARGLVHAVSGVKHECINNDPERTLHLFCVFVPAFEPYGAYPELIQKTQKYLNSMD